MQADFDIVGRESLPLRADAEVLAVVDEVMASMPLPPMELKVNSRPYVVAILDQLEVAESRRSDVLQVIDKVDRKGRAAVEAELGQIGVDAAAIRLLTGRLLDPAAAELSTLEVDARHPGTLGTAAGAILEVMSIFRSMTGRSLAFAPGLVRGLDYYTGIVAESSLAGWERLGSICSGGRYDRLAEVGGQKYPGVGASIGLSRLLVPMSKAHALRVDRQTPTVVLISAPDQLDEAIGVAAVLRSRGIPTEVGSADADRGAHLRYARRLGIPYCFARQHDGWEVRDMRSPDRGPVDPEMWLPDPSTMRASWGVVGHSQP